MSPGAPGPVTVTIERFDPVSGWQYFRTVNVQATGGAALVPDPGCAGRAVAR